LGKRDIVGVGVDAMESQWTPAAASLEFTPSPTLEHGRVTNSCDEVRPCLPVVDERPFAVGVQMKFTSQTLR